jgi:hypothetical protein
MKTTQPLNKVKLKIFIQYRTFLKLVLLVVNLFSFQAFGFDSFLNSSRYKSMAGAGIAATSRMGMEDFGLINPAILSTNSDLVFSSGYTKGRSQDSELSGYSLSVLDSTNGAWDSQHSELLPSNGFPLASVLYYTNLDFNQFKDQYFQLGISQPLSHRMSLGITVNYSILKSDSLNVRESVFDFGAGYLWRAFKDWTFGLSAMNIMDRRDQYIPGYLRRALGAGVEYAASESVKIRADFWRARNASDETKGVFRLGVSNLVAENFMLQFGYADDKSIDSKILAVGFILAGPKLSLSYSLNRETAYNDVLHSVDIRIPVW